MARYVHSQVFDIDGVNRALRDIEAAINALYDGEFERTKIAPSKPKEPTLRYADGVNWNPGTGKGWYSYDESSGAWVVVKNT